MLCNQLGAYEAGQISECASECAADPRKIAEYLRQNGVSVWLDIDRLKEGGGLFESICAGMLASKCVIVFISSEYAQSANCRMEISFATKTLGMKIFPCVVGKDNSWTKTVVGLLIAGDLYLNIQNENSYQVLLTRVREFLASNN